MRRWKGKGGESVNIKKMGNIKKNYRKIKRNRIMIWALMWLNRSVATINATFQLLDIYRLLRWLAQNFLLRKIARNFKHMFGWQYIFYEQDLGTVLRCCLLSLNFKILPCEFFLTERKCIFLRGESKEQYLRCYT